jgi:hypothetical protein
MARLGGRAKVQNIAAEQRAGARAAVKLVQRLGQGGGVSPVALK